MTEILNMNVSGIYLIRNEVNGRYYVGSAVNIKNRWSEHRRTLRLGTHHSRTLQRAWNKYGEDSFAFHLVEIVENKSDLITCEQKWMDMLSPAVPLNGYNINPLAISCLGAKRTEEFCRRLSLMRKGFGKGKKLSPEHRAALHAGKKRAGISEETRAKMSESAKRRTRMSCSEETKMKIGNANRGRKLPPVSEATKRKLSASAKADWVRRKLLLKSKEC